MRSYDVIALDLNVVLVLGVPRTRYDFQFSDELPAVAFISRIHVLCFLDKSKRTNLVRILTIGRLPSLFQSPLRQPVRVGVTFV